MANLAGNAAVTLVFPPREPRGFTLLVDGTAEVTGDDVRVTPATAVLHRPGQPRRRSTGARRLRQRLRAGPRTA